MLRMRKTGPPLVRVPRPFQQDLPVCGTLGPTDDHTSYPKCSLCECNHITAAKACKAIFKNPASSVDAFGRRSIPIKGTTKEQEAETREVLHADPTVASRRGAEEVRRHRPGAAMAATRPALGCNLGCGAAQVAVKIAPSQSPQEAVAAAVLAATGARRRRAKRRRRREVVRDGEPAGRDQSPGPVRIRVPFEIEGRTRRPAREHRQQGGLG